MSSVGDIGGKYQSGVVDSIVGGGLFPKLAGNEYCLKLWKSHIHFEHILYLEFPMDI